MTPIPPGEILFLMQSGWPVDMVFPITVEFINGLRSQVSAGSNQRRGDPEFYRVITLLREIQKSGSVGMRIIREEDEKTSTVMFFHAKNITPAIEEVLREVRGALGLKAGLSEVKVIYGLIPRDDSDIAMLTRSMLHIMVDMATQIDVPPRHVEEGRPIPSLPAPVDSEGKEVKLIRIHSGPGKPEDTFSAVKYKDHWFWIDDRDFLSKRTFAFLMILVSLTETGGKEGLPLVTIPAG